MKRKADDQMPDGMKLCTVCKTPKQLDAFNRNMSRQGGRHSNCKDCDRDRRERTIEENKTKSADAFPKKCRCARCKRSKPRDEFNDDFAKKNGKCSYCIICESAYELIRRFEAKQYRENWFYEQGGCFEPGCGVTNPRHLHVAHLDRDTKTGNPSDIRSIYRLELELTGSRPLCIEHHNRDTEIENGDTQDTSMRLRHMIVRAEKQRRGKCARCPRAYDPTCPSYFHFDHLDARQKDDDICAMVADKRPIEKIITEMKKCQMLCGNCDADVTADRRLDKWRIWIQALGRTKEECLPELAQKWNMDEDEIEDIIDDKNFRRDVLESAFGESWIDHIRWGAA